MDGDTELAFGRHLASYSRLRSDNAEDCLVKAVVLLVGALGRKALGVVAALVPAVENLADDVAVVCIKADDGAAEVGHLCERLASKILGGFRELGQVLGGSRIGPLVDGARGVHAQKARVLEDEPHLDASIQFEREKEVVDGASG